MKRTLTLLAATLMILGLASAAFALETGDDAVDNGDGTYTIDTTDGGSGSIYRDFPDGMPVEEFANNLSFEFDRTNSCGGGSPRVNLHFDNGTYLTTDGPGSPGYSGCANNKGSFAPTTAMDPVWRLHPGTGYLTWSQVASEYGDEEVVRAALVDDSWWSDNYAGVATYSNVVLGGLAPVSKDECKQGGWQHGDYKNQGQCVSSFAKRK